MCKATQREETGRLRVEAPAINRGDLLFETQYAEIAVREIAGDDPGTAEASGQLLAKLEKGIAEDKIQATREEHRLAA